MDSSTIPVYEEGDFSLKTNVIDNGGIGVVGLHRWRLGDHENGFKIDDLVAVKRLGDETSNPKQLEQLKEEAKILWGLHSQCQYILHLFGLVRIKKGFGLALEYMKHGNVSDFFRIMISHANEVDPGNKNFWPLKIQIAGEICKGMAFLHGKGILHRDLKATNVLLDDELNVKICDFGLANIHRLTKTSISNPEASQGQQGPVPGTISHIAPELLRNKDRCTRKSDVYSYGILLWELMSDETPYADVDYRVIMRRIPEGRRPDIKLLPANKPAKLVELMEESWGGDEAERPHFADMIPEFENLYNNWMLKNSVDQAMEIWDGAQATPPKPPVGSTSDACRSTPFFVTQNVQHSPEYVQPVETAPKNHISADEVCISKSSTCHEDPFQVNNDQENLLSARNLQQRPDNPEIIVPPQKNLCKYLVFVSAVAILAVVGCISFAVFFVTMVQYNPGCCTHCFNASDPGMTIKCDLQNYSEENKSTKPGSNCTFSCKDGFVVNGRNKTTLYCDVNGKWSGAMPYCRKIRQCSTLPNPANGGTVRCSNKNYELSSCQFQCPAGYRLRVPKDSSEPYQISCASDEFSNFHWSGPVPFCQKATPCTPLPKRSEVSHSCTPGDESKNLVETSLGNLGPSYYNGTSCTLWCTGPKSLSTLSNHTICLDNGTWDIGHPECVDGCPKFAIPANGKLDSCTLGEKYDSKCNFSCNPNFVKLGEGYMVCEKSGEWNNNPPRCICPVCRSGTKCEKSISFSEAASQWNESESHKIEYDGREIMCSILKNVQWEKKMQEKLPTSYSCQCRDKDNRIKQCNGIKSQQDTCTQTLASLIFLEADHGIYTFPCDAEKMPNPC